MSTALVYFKALSDQTRLRLTRILQQYELSVNELVQLLGMGQSRISRHLKILADAGLLTWRRDGLWVFYRAAEGGSGNAFLDAMSPFLEEDPALRADVDMAARILEDRSRKTRQFFNAIAEDWDALNREVLGDFDLAEAVCAAMPANCGAAADLGCGTGMVLERMRFHARELIGVDGSSRMLELARRRFSASGGQGDADPQVSLRIGELEHLPLRDGEAHFACINLVLHHLSEPLPALKEIRRILQPGGLLLAADFDKHGNERMRKDYGDRWLGFDEAALHTMFAKAGFVALRTTRRPVGKGLCLLLILAEAA
ncbi:MAG: metalloregulator ArsR/SmtB family transcription factor [Deltaproteobacteria bacterium]|nr:metalloregulator ArsR/SmtB family transcription factor [Deltaproteobacteria bacterium]